MGGRRLLRADRGGSRALADPGRLVTAGVVLAVAALHLWISPSNPPGFIRDEASISYNAYSLSQNLRDQDGGLLPLYVVSFSDYKSPLFVYLLAGVFRVTGPDPQVARGLASACVLGAVLLLGLLAWRRTRSGVAAVATVVLAGLTPWLFELGRVALETTLEPLVITVLLLIVDWAYRSERRTVERAVPVGLALGALTYVYAAGRLLAPLFALALLAFAGRGRWRWLVATWAAFAATFLPLAVYAVRHPGALTARYRATTFVEDGMSVAEIIRRAASNYVHDVNLWHWITEGDPKPYIHTWGGTGQLLAAVVALAIAGIVLVLLRERSDPWWRYVLVLLVLAPIPAALTEDRFYSLRLLPIPLLLVVLAMPAVAALVAAAASRWLPRLALVAVALAVAIQFGQFNDVFSSRGGERTTLFEAGVPDLLRHAFADGRTVFIDYDDRYAQTHALWYAVSHGLPEERVSILPDGGIPPVGSRVFGRFQACDYVCQELRRWHEYWIATAIGPRPTP
jgi:hypothetical protein